MKALIGSWRLESVEYHVKGKCVYPFGVHPTGRLMYSENGYMSAILMKSDRKCIGFPSDLFYTSGISIFFRCRGFLRYINASIRGSSYSGRYIREGNKVTHYIDTASYPDLEGKERIRWIKFEGDKLIIETEDVAGCHGRLVWLREKSL